jgi:hypothetical protein
MMQYRCTEHSVKTLIWISTYPKTHGHAVIARSASDRLQRAQPG